MSVAKKHEIMSQFRKMAHAAYILFTRRLHRVGLQTDTPFASRFNKIIKKVNSINNVT